jgi:hypothetical protein
MISTAEVSADSLDEHTYRHTAVVALDASMQTLEHLT